MDEIRKHPGISAGAAAALLIGAGLALYLGQRTGPTRYQQFKTRIHPRSWIDADALRGRCDEAVSAARYGAADAVDDLGHRAATLSRGAGRRAVDLSRDARSKASLFARDAHERADEWFAQAQKGSRKALKKHGKTARRYADEAGVYARDHAKEGGALLAVATIAAAIGAAVLESRRPDSHVRRIARF
ncbi:hypothetical protein LTR94_025818 [Friedmanniomyces endolithicus]|nr:hypothetical protein LTR94_025818 [Friedmanniomyces endolithicus]